MVPVTGLHVCPHEHRRVMCGPLRPPSIPLAGRDELQRGDGDAGRTVSAVVDGSGGGGEPACKPPPPHHGIRGDGLHRGECAVFIPWCAITRSRSSPAPLLFYSLQAFQSIPSLKVVECFVQGASAGPGGNPIHLLDFSFDSHRDCVPLCLPHSWGDVLRSHRQLEHPDHVQ